MKRLTASIILVAVVLAAVGLAPGALAQPTADTWCTDCHFTDKKPKTIDYSIALQSREVTESGEATSTYAVTAQYGKYLAVFDGYNKVGQSIKFKNSVAQVSVPASSQYKFFIVRDAKNARSFDVSPTASSECTVTLTSVTGTKVKGAKGTFQKGKRLTVKGTLEPSHDADTKVTLYFWKITKTGKYPKGAEFSRTFTVKAGETDFTWSAKMPSARKWRVQARHSCADHTLEKSNYLYFTVK